MIDRTVVRVINGVAIAHVFVQVLLHYNQANRYGYGAYQPYICKVLEKNNRKGRYFLDLTDKTLGHRQRR